MNRNNIGKFEISEKAIETNPEEVAEVFAQLKVIPVRIEYVFFPEAIQYTGISSRFREISEGEAIPKYEIIMNKQKAQISVSVAEQLKKC